jgi:hypothetical protein
MTEATQHFSFLIAASAGQQGDVRLKPVISICLQRWRPSGSGMPIIGTYMNTDRDIDLQIDSLIANLEAVRTAAKRTLESAALGSTQPTDQMAAAD